MCGSRKTSKNIKHTIKILRVRWQCYKICNWYLRPSVLNPIKNVERKCVKKTIAITSAQYLEERYKHREYSLPRSNINLCSNYYAIAIRFLLAALPWSKRNDNLFVFFLNFYIQLKSRQVNRIFQNKNFFFLYKNRMDERLAATSVKMKLSSLIITNHVRCWTCNKP